VRTGIAANVESLSRDSNGLIHFTGFAVDTDPTADPVVVYLFLDGSAAGKAEAKGIRPDLSPQYGLDYYSAANVAFDGRSIEPFACPEVKNILVLAVNQHMEFAGFEPKLTVGGCS
jgi:hypothetical protein